MVAMIAAENTWTPSPMGTPRYALDGLGGHTRARASANKPISITPPPEAKLLRSQLGPEQGTT